jgi:hypothetical protein
MVKLLSEAKATLSIPLNDTIGLDQIEVEHAALARRDRDEDNIQSLFLSNPKEWPNILVTKTDRGYLVIDGYHRIEVARMKKLATLKGTVKAFDNFNEVIKAAFLANMNHGLRLSFTNRSEFAWWLHQAYPQMEQIEIARMARIDQSTVSRAWSRRLIQDETGIRLAEPVHEKTSAAAEDRQTHLQRSWRGLTRNAEKLFAEIAEMDDAEAIGALTQVIGEANLEQLSRIVHLLEEGMKTTAPPVPPVPQPQEAPTKKRTTKKRPGGAAI